MVAEKGFWSCALLHMQGAAVGRTVAMELIMQNPCPLRQKAWPCGGHRGDGGTILYEPCTS